MKVGDIVEILIEDIEEINKEARIVDIDGPLVYVSNMNMPFQGTFARVPFTKNEIKVKKCRKIA